MEQQVNELIPQEKRVYSAIGILELQFGRRPTHRELCAETGFKSKASINKYIVSLEIKGYVKRNYNGISTLKYRAAKESDENDDL